MCNANNHPPGCSCGWGGVWYGAGHDDAAWLFNRSPPPRKLGRQKGTFGALSSSATVPNSRCPVCDAAVFYYESPNGGRVFFDALGPPWPKHPCTDNGVAEKSIKTFNKAWHVNDWLPLIEASIEQAIGQTDVYSLNGMRDGRKFRFYFKSLEIVMAEIIRVKPLDKGTFLVSILDFHAPRGEWAIWTGSVFSTEEAVRVGGVPLKRTKLHSHFVKHPAGNALQHPGSRAVVPPKPAFLAPPGAPLGISPLRPVGNQLDLVQCPDCPSRISERNFLLHLRRVHGYRPLGTRTKITGRMLVG